MSELSDEQKIKLSELEEKLQTLTQQLEDTQTKINEKEKSREGFGEQRKALWEKLSKFRATKNEEYATMQQLRVELSSLEKDRMQARSQLQASRRNVQFDDMKSLEKALKILQTEAREGKRVGPQIADVQSQRAAVLAHEKLQESANEGDAKIADVRKNLEQLRKKGGSQRKQELKLNGEVAKITKTEDKIAREINGLKNSRRKAGVHKRKTMDAIAALKSGGGKPAGKKKEGKAPGKAKGQKEQSKAQTPKKAAPTAPAPAPEKKPAPQRNQYAAERAAVMSLIFYLRTLVPASSETKQETKNQPVGRRSRNEGFGGRKIQEPVESKAAAPTPSKNKRKRNRNRKNVTRSVLVHLTHTPAHTALFHKVGVAPPSYLSNVNDTIEQLNARTKFYEASPEEQAKDTEAKLLAAENLERSANRRRSLSEMDAEQMRRVQEQEAAKAEATAIEASERAASQSQAKAAAETARAERIGELGTDAAIEASERAANQSQAKAAAEAARAERIGELETTEEAKANRDANVAKATELAESERTRRMSVSAEPAAMFSEQEALSKYRTYDDDKCMGKEAPPLTGLDYVTGEDRARPAPGDVTVVVFWAKFHKAGFRFLPLYTELQKEYAAAGLKVVGLAIDLQKSDVNAFLEDPKGKYAKSFTTEFAIAHDEKRGLQAQFSAVLGTSMQLVSSFLINKEGKIVWHQDHSQIGATPPTFMNAMRLAVQATLADQPVPSVGNQAVQAVNSSDEEEDEEIGNMAEMVL
jgi:uncharacterized coiled-coil DUF342 family protein/thiol-disulfide isomerase/thioredoxin